jgi:Flp pilus assembly protein TadD
VILKAWLYSWSFSLLANVLIVLPAAAQFAAQSPEPGQQPVTSTQIAAWLVGGVPSGRLERLVLERGLATLPTHSELHQLESAGANPQLMKALDSGFALSAKVGPALQEDLMKAAAEARQQHFKEAEAALRAAVVTDPENSALHFALGVIYRQQEKWDDAYDELTEATRLMPELPENHGALAYLFYRMDDGPNAISEARTALSLDPKNAEAYHMLAACQAAQGQFDKAMVSAQAAWPRDIR